MTKSTARSFGKLTEPKAGRPYSSISNRTQKVRLIVCSPGTLTFSVKDYFFLRIVSRTEVFGAPTEQLMAPTELMTGLNLLLLRI